MTDPLSAKELVERSYLYVDRVLKECKKNHIPAILAQKEQLDENKLGDYLGTSLEEWFGKRDRLLNIRWQRQPIKVGPKNDIHLVFSGKSKDAKFTLSCDAEVFPVTDKLTGKRKFYIKSANLSTERSRFERP